MKSYPCGDPRNKDPFFYQPEVQWFMSCHGFWKVAQMPSETPTLWQFATLRDPPSGFSLFIMGNSRLASFSLVFDMAKLEFFVFLKAFAHLDPWHADFLANEVPFWWWFLEVSLRSLGKMNPFWRSNSFQMAGISTWNHLFVENVFGTRPLPKVGSTTK